MPPLVCKVLRQRRRAPRPRLSVTHDARARRHRHRLLRNELPALGADFQGERSGKAAERARAEHDGEELHRARRDRALCRLHEKVRHRAARGEAHDAVGREVAQLDVQVAVAVAGHVAEDEAARRDLDGSWQRGPAERQNARLLARARSARAFEDCREAVHAGRRVLRS